jgi:thymidylate kinase
VADALIFQALQVMNRMEIMPELLDASLDEPEGPRIVLSRYWQSGWVYGQIDGLNPDFLQKIHETMAHPDVNILLDVDARTCLERQRARGLPVERYEGKEDLMFKVVSLYRELWAKQRVASWPNRYGAIWHVIDATRDISEVVADALEICCTSLHRIEEGDND